MQVTPFHANFLIFPVERMSMHTDITSSAEKTLTIKCIIDRLRLFIKVCGPVIDFIKVFGQ